MAATLLYCCGLAHKVRLVILLSSLLTIANSTTLLLCNNYLHIGSAFALHLNILLPLLVASSTIITSITIYLTTRGVAFSLPAPIHHALILSRLLALLHLTSTAWLVLTGAISSHPSPCLLTTSLVQLVILATSIYSIYFLWQLWKDISFNGGLVRVGAVVPLPTLSLAVQHKGLNIGQRGLEEEQNVTNEEKEERGGVDNNAFEPEI